MTVLAVMGGAFQGYSQPTTGGPTPTAPQGHVISVYDSSDVYTNISIPAGYFNDWYNPGYSGGTGYYDVDGTTNVLEYAAPVVIWGIDFSANPQNVKGCTNLHVDIWSPTATTYDIRIVNTVGGSQQADATGTIVTNGWNSLDLPLSLFTTANPSMSLVGIGQIGIVGDGMADSTYYIDNLYFQAGTNLVYVPPPVVPAPTNNAPTPTRTNVLALYDSSGTYAFAPYVDFPAPWSGSAQTAFTITNTGSVVEYLHALTYVGEDYYSPDQIDAAAYSTMHIDLWTATGNQFYIQLVSLSPTESAQVGVFNMATNQWVGLDIPISEFAASNSLTDLTAIQQILWVDNIGPGLQAADFYFDNVYFYGTPAASAPTITLTASGENLSLSFPTQNGFTYTVQYKTSLPGGTWQTLSVVSGNGSTQTVTDTANQTARFYRVSVN